MKKTKVSGKNEVKNQFDSQFNTQPNSQSNTQSNAQSSLQAQSKPQSQPNPQTYSQVIFQSKVASKTHQIEYVRRCHLCLSTTESKEVPVDKCSCCGKSFPQLFFCEELKNLDHKTGDYPPIIGFSLCWD